MEVVVQSVSTPLGKVGAGLFETHANLTDAIPFDFPQETNADTLAGAEEPAGVARRHAVHVL